MEIYERFLTHCDAYRAATPLTPKGIMVHSTAAPAAMAKDFLASWDVPNLGKSVHGFLDNTGFYQTLPFNYKAGHCGGAGNSYLIGFEICEPSGLKYNSSMSTILEYNPPEGYFETIWENATDLCVYLCNQFNLTANDIICHCEGAQMGIASAHADVMHWFVWEGKTMDDFREAVNVKMGSPVEVNVNKGNVPIPDSGGSVDTPDSNINVTVGVDNSSLAVVIILGLLLTALLFFALGGMTLWNM